MKPAEERFKIGDIVRYGSGVSSLFRYDGPVNVGRLYGTHVLGGAIGASDQTFFDLQPASAEDIEFCKSKQPGWFSVSHDVSHATDHSLAEKVLARWRDRFPNNAYAWPGAPESFAIEAVKIVREQLNPLQLPGSVSTSLDGRGGAT